MSAVDLGVYAEDPRIMRVGHCAVWVVNGWVRQTSQNVLAFAGDDDTGIGVPFADMTGALRWLLGGPPLTPLAYALRKAFSAAEILGMRQDIGFLMDSMSAEFGAWDRLDGALRDAVAEDEAAAWARLGFEADD